MSQLFLMVLFVIAAAVEVTLLVASDAIFGTGRTKALEAEIRRTQDDLKEAAKRVKERQGKLQEVYAEGERLISMMNDIDKQASQTLKVRPFLIHIAGQPGTGKHFRARVTKNLPPDVEPKQKLIWDHENYVEVWTDDLATARQVALRQFAAEAGYSVTDFVARGTAPVAETPAAAVPEKVS